jgi:pimeloyl-ACP methyl ester carboxylesterase
VSQKISQGLFLLFILSLSTACTNSKEIKVKSLSQVQREILQSQAQVGNFLKPDDVLPTVPPTKEERCQERISALPADYIHGWLEVPETPGDDASPKINIFYYGRVKTDKLQNQDVTIFFNGGPGGDSESSFSKLNSLQLADEAKNKTNFLFIDQRGNGCSDFYPQGTSEAVMHRLANYGTRGIVADSELIREHLLGNQKWRVFGQSYGAYVVHKYAILSPDSISKAYAHANAITPSAVMRHAERIASQDRIIKEYFKIYPEDEAKLKIMNDVLLDKPCVVDENDKKYCGYVLVTPFTSMLGFRTSWGTLHSWLSAVVASPKDGVNTEVLGKLALWYLVDDDAAWNKKDMMHNVVAYVDRNYTDLEGKLCEKVHAELRGRGLSPENFILDECKDENVTYRDGSRGEIDQTDYALIAKLKTDWMTFEQLKESLQSHPDLEFNLYSGELDSFVPVANFKAEVEMLAPYINYTHFTTSGHDGFYSEPKVWED